MGWRPAIYAWKGSKKKLAVEIIANGEIPAHLTNTLRLCQRQLSKLDVRLMAVVPEGVVPSSDLRNASLEFDLRVCAVSRTDFREIFSRKMFQQIARAQPAEICQFRQERDAGRHIPAVLLNLVRNLRHSKIRTQLKAFADKYEIQDFTGRGLDPLTAEYEFVFQFLSGLPTKLLSPREVSRLDIGHKVERMRLQAGDYRDHFIHSFQVFLTGLAIIDSHHNSFRKWMRYGSHKHVEETWFLASIFHDLLRPHENFDWLGEQEGLEMGMHYVKWREIMALLGATYGKRMGNAGTRTGKARKLERILQAHYKRGPRNHGLLAALDIITSVSGLNVRATPFHVADAAQCIAIHDKGVWEDLARAHIMPLAIEEDPIGYLLIYCDTAQEWGRPGMPKGQQVGLVEIEVEREVRCSVFFEDPADAVPKLNECPNISRCLKRTSIPCTFSIKIPLAA